MTDRERERKEYEDLLEYQREQERKEVIEYNKRACRD